MNVLENLDEYENNSNFILTDVEAKLIEMKCSKCNEGKLIDTGKQYLTNPPLYEMQCDKCGEFITNSSKFPQLRFFKKTVEEKKYSYSLDVSKILNKNRIINEELEATRIAFVEKNNIYDFILKKAMHARENFLNPVYVILDIGSYLELQNFLKIQTKSKNEDEDKKEIKEIFGLKIVKIKTIEKIIDLGYDEVKGLI